MPHTYPKRDFQSGDVVDPDVFNDALQGAAQKLSGRLNEHDFDAASVKASLSVADGAYYGAHMVVKASDPGFTRGGGFYYAAIDGSGGDAVATIDDTAAWQSIQDDGGTDTLAVTPTCGDEDTLVLIAQLQHFAWSGSDTSLAADRGAPVKLQYAFRVDGSIIPETITGAAFYPDPPPQQWYRAVASGGQDWDFRHILRVQNTVGINPAVYPARLMWSTKASSGSHTVEVVARRIPMSDYKIDTAGDGTTVQVFNRRLLCLRIKGWSPYTGGIPDVSVHPISDGDVITADDVGVNGFGVLATAVNDLVAAHVSRGAFANQHLPSVVYDPKAQPITPGSPTGAITGRYPGYGVNSPAWTVVNDGLGTNLQITPTAATWDLDTNDGLFIVLANVHVAYVQWTGASAPSDDLRALGILALRITNSAGGVTLLGATEAVVNSHVANNDTTAAGPDIENIEQDVPLMWVVDSNDLSAADRQITKIEVVASVWDGAAGTNPVEVEMKTQQGCLVGFGLKGVHLA